MLKWLLRWVIATVALFVTLQLVDYFDKESTMSTNWGTLAVAVVVLAIVNAFIRPIIQILALPITCLTLGLFSLVINAALFYGVGEVTGAYHVSFLGALAGSIVMGLINGAISSMIIDDDKK